MSDLVTKVMNTDVAPAFLTQGGATGFENMDNDCISIPFLRLAQVNTPQAQPGQDQLPGLQAGMYFNPSTGRIYGKEPRLIILGFNRTWNMWFGEPPAAKFVRTMSNDEFERDYRAKTENVNGKIVDKEGNRYQDTRNFFVMSAEHPEDGALLYPMTSTGIPASKKWLAKSAAIRVKTADGKLAQAPMWSRIWGLKVNFIQSPKGNYFQVNDVADCGWITADLAPGAEAAFNEVLAYDKSRVAGVEKTHDDDPTKDW